MKRSQVHKPAPAGVLGIGVDMMETARIRRAVAREGWGFLSEFLSDSEIDRCRRARYPLPAAAAAFAAKEAFFKALGTGRSGKLSWHDVEIQPVSTLKVTGEASRAAESSGVGAFHLSLTWLGPKAEIAVATVFLEGKSPRTVELDGERIRRGKRVQLPRALPPDHMG